VLRWPGFGCSRRGVRSGWAACSWCRLRGVLVLLREGAHLGLRDDIENGRGNALVLRWPARVSGVLWASESRRSCGLCLGRGHVSALGMTLKMGVETLWCHAGQHLAVPEGVCGVSGRRGLGVGFAAVVGIAKVGGTSRPSGWH
jgi:hypothetical protein